MDTGSPSSPDPLNDSLISRAPPSTKLPSTKRRKTPYSRLSLPTPGSSPRKQVFELDVGNEIAPQKIRVTVQAGDSDEEDDHANLRPHNFSSPTPAPFPRRIERTTTTTVPLRGLSDTEDNNINYGATPKRGRGRPRKSMTPLKIAPTPARGRKRGRKSIGDQADDQNANNQGEDTEGERSTKKPRSNSTKARSPKKSTPSKPKAASKAVPSTGKRGRGRPKSRLREEIRLSEERNEVTDEAQLPKEKDVSAEPEAHEDISPEELMLLETIDADPSSPSTSHFPSSEGDVVIARFHPGEETPPTTGWSSSRIMDESQKLSSSPEARVGRGPSQESQGGADFLSQSRLTEENNEVYDHNNDSDVMGESQDEDEVADAGGHQIDFSEDEMEDDDEDHEHRPEFDTIMESEGFSLISINSVPSLKKPLSALIQDQVQNSVARPQHTNLLSVQEKNLSRHNDSFSSIPPEILEAATPGRKLHNPQHLRVQNTRTEDSFSSIAPEILEAATPGPIQNARNTQPSLSPEIEDDLPDMIRDRKTSSRSPSKTTAHGTHEDASAKPPATLKDAATRLMRQAPIRRVSLAKFEDTPKSASTPQKESQPAGYSRSTKSPSPPARNAEDTYLATSKPESTKSIATQDAEQQEEDPLIDTEMNSSPPAMAPQRFSYNEHLRQQRQTNPNMTQTPPILFSSPSLPPPIQPSRQPSERPESSTTNAPSPAEKAGRVLQDIVIPSSLPRSRSQSLASPFKSPAERRSSLSIHPESNATHSLPPDQTHLSLPRLDHNGDLVPQSSRRKSWSRPVQDDDSSNENKITQRRSPTHESHSTGLPSSRRLSNSINAMFNPQVEMTRNRQSPKDVHGNVSQERQLPSSSQSRNHGNSVEQKKMSLNEKWAAERAAVSKQISTANPDQVIALSSDDEEEEEEEDRDDEGVVDIDADVVDAVNDRDSVSQHDEHDENQNYGDNLDEEDEESFGLLLDALNSEHNSIPSSPQRNNRPNSDLLDKSRRSKIPSPRRTNSKSLAYSDELSPPMGIGNEEPSPRTVTHPTGGERSSRPEPSADGDDSTLDLSGWHIPQKANFRPRPRSRSRSVIPEICALSGDGRRVGKAERKRSDRPPAGSKSPSRPEPSIDGSDALESSGWHVPRKANYQPRPLLQSNSGRSEEISALLGSPIQVFPGTNDRRARVDSEDSEDSSQPVLNRVTSSSKTRTTDPQVSDPKRSSSNSYLNEEKVEPYAPIPQKMGFQPRMRKPTESRSPSPFQQSAPRSKGMFGQASASTSDKNNLPTPDLSSSSMVGTLTNISPNRSNTLKNQSTHEPLSRNTSLDTKENENQNRSEQVKPPNLKWTKSVHLEASIPMPPSPTKSILRSPQRPSFSNFFGAARAQPSPSKSVVFASSSPQSQSSSPSTPPLSPTTWTRNHWILLEAILQTWKPISNNSDNQQQQNEEKYGRRNSTRVISGLLGKWVTLKGEEGSEKERMRLQQWHLEAVDEFRGEVPGWDERVVAKRVFALLVGEERRRKGGKT